MTEFPGIKYDLQLRKSIDYSFLRKEGIQYVQQLSGKIWTDYNEHDPGVTILEQLCYALTDIGYKTNLDIRKLVFAGADEDVVLRSNGIYPPEEIFLSGTVTNNDFRILFINALKKDKVDNIWFKEDTRSRVAGLYNIYVRTSAPASAYESLEKKVREIYAAHRSLGEDLHRVIILKPEYIEIVASIDITEEVSPEKVLAEMFLQINEYFNPPVMNTSFHDLVNAGLGYEEIFNLPSFEHGFIRNLRPHEDTGVFSLSGINGIIAAIPGIRNVKNLHVKKDGIRVTGKYITIDDGHVPEILIIPDKIAITAFRNYNKVNYDGYLVKRYYQERLEQENKSYPFTPLTPEKLSDNFRTEIRSYTSVQDTFPITYGIGKYGLPGNAGKDRILYARQLQSYLLFFDQLMINHLAQLENLPHLFSYKTNEASATYFTRLPDRFDNEAEVSDFNKLIHPDLDNAQLYKLVHENFLERKNRLLDHLLARFSEEFIDRQYPNLAALHGLTNEGDLTGTLVTLKSSMLEQYEVLSRERNRGLNYISPSQRSYPFKTRLYLLLNLPLENENATSLTDHYRFLTAREIRESDGNDELLAKDDLRKVRFKVLNHAEARDQLVFYGALHDSYSIKRSAEEIKYTVLFHSPKEPVPVTLAEYDSLKKSESVVTALVNRFRDLNKKAEAFHVIEHILLRPLLDRQYDIEISIANQKDKLILRSVQSDYLEEQNELLVDAVICGTNINNYQIREIANEYFISLVDKLGNELLQVEKTFQDYKKASECVHEVIMPYFWKTSREKHTIPPDANIKQVAEIEQQEGFQTQKITLVFPKWIPRFMDPDFERLLQYCLVRCVPAHLGLHVIWMNLNRMSEFERKYNEWLELKSQIVGKQNSWLESRTAFENDSKISSEPLRRREKRALRNAIIQLDKLSNDLVNSYLISEGA